MASAQTNDLSKSLEQILASKPKKKTYTFLGEHSFGEACEECGHDYEDHHGDENVCPKSKGHAISHVKKFGSDDYYKMHPCLSCGLSYDAHSGNRCPDWTVQIKNITPPSQLRTQKARGVHALRTCYLHGVVNPSANTVAIEKAKPETFVGRFVRPCPVTPRHGFVDSRKVTTLEEAKALIEETRKADPKAEFLLMTEIKATANGIWTPGLLTLGPGNDGATAGREALSLPVLGELLPESVIKSAHVTDAPYVEIVYDHNHTPNFVQLRNGPKLEALGVDYIPARMKVKHVVKAEGDLLEWERKVKEFPAGTAVWHPEGSLASHYAVHAVLSQVPVLVSRKPRKGSTLFPTQVALNGAIDIQRLRAGFIAALKDKNIDLARAGYFMLAGLHNFVAWKGREDLALGMAMGYGARLAVVATIGEFRHKPRMVSKAVKSSRDGEYQTHWPRVLSARTIGRYLRALKSFISEHWNGDMGSYGGVKWYEFGVAALKMYNALVAGDSDLALSTFNVLVNAVHNGGWGFNKFLDENFMNAAAKSASLAAVWAGADIYRMLHKTGKLEVETLGTWENAPRFAEARVELKLDGLTLAELNERWLEKRCGTKGCMTCFARFGDADESNPDLIAKECFIDGCTKTFKTYAAHKKHLQLSHGYGSLTASSHAELAMEGKKWAAHKAEQAKKASEAILAMQKKMEQAKEQEKAAQALKEVEAGVKEALEKPSPPAPSKLLKFHAPGEAVAPTPKPSAITHVQTCVRDGSTLHSQIVRVGYPLGKYDKKDKTLSVEVAPIVEALKALPQNTSLAQTETKYAVLPHEGGTWYIPLKSGLKYVVADE